LSLDPTELRSRKARLNIIIFGSYTSVARLEDLRECLREDGYSARLVKDIDYPAQNPGETTLQYILRKCYYWLENSGANFLVFFRNTPNEGVSLELGKVPKERVDWSTVFCDGGIDRFSSMLQGTVKGKLHHYDFTTDRNLCENAKAAAWVLFSKSSY
jgi:hypothetical protein